MSEPSGWDLAVRRYRVAGRVQSVGYRAFVARVARALALKGGASNLEDGGVEIVASGPVHALERFEAALNEGPRMSRVDRVDLEVLEVLPPTDPHDVEF
jgi:acylphosphatase